MQAQVVIVSGGDERFGQRRRTDAARHADAEVAAEAFQYHVVGVHLAVGAVSCYVGRGYPCLVHEPEVYVRFVLPGVDNGISYLIIYKGIEQGVVVNHRAAARVDYHRPPAEAVEEAVAGQVVCGVGAVLCQRHVERYHVALPFNLVHRYELPLVAALLSRRVAHEHAHSVFFRYLLHLRAYVTAANYAYGRAFKGHALLSFQQQKHRAHVLRHRGGVAPRTAHPLYAGAPHVAGVYVVEAYRGGRHELYAAALEQCFVASGACAHYQGVGVAHVFGADFRAFLVHRVSRNTAYGLADVRYLVVDYYFHLLRFLVSPCCRRDLQNY